MIREIRIGVRGHAEAEEREREREEAADLSARWTQGPAPAVAKDHAGGAGGVCCRR